MIKVYQYFSDFFEIDSETIRSYGAIDISLISDLPLFIDPFLLFHSDKKEYQEVHDEIISYLVFLKTQGEEYSSVTDGMLKAWYLFSEVKETWLGYSLKGNEGKGLGKTFALNLHNAFQNLLGNFGEEKITKGSHLEKLCLISDFVGKDKISDFTTNFTKKYLLEYTSMFAKLYLKEEHCKTFSVKRVSFNYKTMSWVSGNYYLPCFKNNFVLLTPRDLLTKDETFINKLDMINNLEEIANSVDDDHLRFSLNKYFISEINDKNKKMTKSEKKNIAMSFIKRHPEIIDYYILHKEKNGDEAISINKKAVKEVEYLFKAQTKKISESLLNDTDFYEKDGDSYEESFERVMYLKQQIENQDGYRIFYLNGKPIKREIDLQILFNLVWCGSSMDVNREVNNGRGAVDFKISSGSSDSCLVEFKLASNTKLKQNLKNQVEVYKKANKTNKALIVILYFTDKEHENIMKILNELNLQHDKNIIIIDAINNKRSASNVI